MRCKVKNIYELLHAIKKTPPSFLGGVLIIPEESLILYSTTPFLDHTTLLNAIIDSFFNGTHDICKGLIGYIWLESFNAGIDIWSTFSFAHNIRS